MKLTHSTAFSYNQERAAPSQISGVTCHFTNTNVRSVTTALRRFRSSPILTLRSVRGVEAQSNSCSRLPQFSSKGRVGMSRTTPKSQVRPPNHLPTAVPPIKVRRLKKKKKQNPSRSTRKAKRNTEEEYSRLSQVHSSPIPTSNGSPRETFRRTLHPCIVCS